MQTDLPKPTLSNPVHFLAFGFGSGCSPQAPGTMGTLMAVALYIPMSYLDLGFYLAVVAVMAVLGIWLCERTSRDLGVHDHPGIVWDEIVGYLLTMAAIPFSIGWMIAGFALFRLFDIWKPWPIGWLDKRVSGGLGIMLDDLVAAVFAWLVLQGVMYWTS